MRVVCFIVIIGFVSVSVQAQSNSNGTQKWPSDPPVGIGTELSTPSGPQNAVHIHYDPLHSQEAILRLSTGTRATTDTFGILGLMHGSGSTYSSLSSGLDLVLH